MLEIKNITTPNPHFKRNLIRLIEISMSKFLQDLANDIYQQYGKEMSNVKVIFPNRRAGLFFQQHLSKLIENPVWSPEVLSIDDFVENFCSWQKADKLSLIFELYDTYTQVNPTDETFDQFYFWGEMLLKDFDDIDRNLVNARHLFSVLMRQKELDISFDVLTEEQKILMQTFWKHFADRQSRHKDEFLALWTVLFKVYEDFRAKLIAKNCAYEGMVYREVAEKIQQGANIEGDLVFAGFNAFTKSEETIFSYLIVEHNARFYWDADSYYVDNNVQEAGMYFRAHRDHPIFGRTFPQELPKILADKNKNIELIGVPQLVGQAKLLGEMLRKLKEEDPDLKEDEIVVVLPDENLLFPVLHSLPDNFNTFNVTMGYPLRNTPLFNLLENLVELQAYFKEIEGQWQIHHRPLLQVLRHSYIQMLDKGKVNELIAKIVSENLIRLPLSLLTEYLPLLQKIVRKQKGGLDLFDYLLEVILLLRESFFEAGDEDSIEQEYFYQFYTHLLKLKETMESRQIDLEPDVFLKLFRQVIQSLRLPFSGEPLNGLQIMGVLETRNLDFKHVFVLCLNEGAFPAAASAHSFVPYNLRKAFEMPTFDHQDAIYAYLFYRLLQRAENVHLMYSTEDSGGLKGEPSRYVAQLLFEGPWTVQRKFLHNEIQVHAPAVITIDKHTEVLEKLGKFQALRGALPEKYLTPSALSTYLDCRLRFYYRYIAKLYESEEIQEEVDARFFGLLLHDALENIYKRLINRKKSNLIGKGDFEFLKGQIDLCINEAFAGLFGNDRKKNFSFEGRNIIIRAIIRKFVQRVLEMDADYAPFEILGLETEGEDAYRHLYHVSSSGNGFVVGLEGKIDRLDKKDRQIRVVDYKTGKDDKHFLSIASLFDRDEKKRNKAAMQALFYSMLYLEKHQPDAAVAPAIINAKELFDQHFDWKIGQKEGRNASNPVTDSKLYMPEFKEHLDILLQEVFDPGTPFSQTDDLLKCGYCPYAGLCRRD